MNTKTYKFKGIIKENGLDSFIEFPHDVKEEFGTETVKVFVTFDGVPCDMKIGRDRMIEVGDALLKQLTKQKGDFVKVTLRERD